MIVVAGFNTAIDVQIDVDTLQPGRVQRSSAARRAFGGKGLHVAQTIAALGEPVRLVGLTDATHRARLGQALRERDVDFHAIEAGPLRECWAIRECDGRTTELLQPGPILDRTQVQALCEALLRATQDATLVVLSGSLPPGCDDDLYAGLVERLQARGLRCLLDASGAALQRGVAAKPYALKPNRDELEGLTGMHIATLEDGVDALAVLRNAGIAAPLLSLGDAGALLATDHGTWHAHAPVAAPVHTIGSGDCLLAGFATALQRGLDDGQALRLAVACGAANAAREEPGYVPPGVAAQWLDRVELRTLGDREQRS